MELEEGEQTASVPERLQDSKQEKIGCKAGQSDASPHSSVVEQTAKDVWLLLVIFRCVNAVCVKTFFQPDEYYQSLEPAWQMAFGSDSNAWITWEWHHQLRSSLHPALFAAMYWTIDSSLAFVQCFPQFRAMVLSVLPNLVQAFCAAYSDYYTWQMAEKVYGTNSDVAWTALWATVFSPWQWFCSTRTFSNSLETTLTITALYHWPWRMTLESKSANSLTSNATSVQDRNQLPKILDSVTTRKNLRIALFLAALACLLRPTNLLIWFPIVMPTILNALPWLSSFTSLSQVRLAIRDHTTFLFEALLCGSIVGLVSALSDRLYFGRWTFPPFEWLEFNVSQDLAVFYGRNDWHYYLTQGLPLLLTTYMPFTLVSLYKSIFSFATPSQRRQPFQTLFATVIMVSMGSLSFISHKEVRFIYPLLPLLHIVTAPAIFSFFTSSLKQASAPISNSHLSPTTTQLNIHRKPLLFLLLAVNLFIASYTTLVHQRGVLSVLTFLRGEYEELALDYRGVPLYSPLSTHPPDSQPKRTDYDPLETFVAFLTPCHSTPWRSQLFYPHLRAWALTCEPPLHLAAHTEKRQRYRDEADRFFDNPKLFLSTEVGGRERPWPRYVVGFEGIERDLREWYEENIKGWVVRERWRTGNSQWHDDWRRRGDIVVWEFVEGSKVETV